MSTLRNAAAEYRAAGLSVFAVAAKAPLVRWAAYAKRQPTERELRAMPWSRATGIALALGPASGGLACRDWDDTDSYAAWAERNRWLAGECPTAKTSRGYHVYFRATAKMKTVNCGDGELRVAGAYVLLPPSLHPSGIEYAWQGEPLSLITDSPEVDCQVLIKSWRFC